MTLHTPDFNVYCALTSRLFSQFETPPSENGNMLPANAPQAKAAKSQKKVGDVWRQQRVFFLINEKICSFSAASHPALAETLK